MAKPRIIIADDHTLLVEAFEKLLAPECEILAKVADGRALVKAVRELHPDLVVLDVTMPLLNGLDAARQIKQIDASVRLVFVTMNEDPDVAAEAFRAGAAAYLLKRSAGAELLTAIREAMKHRSYVTPLVTEGMLDSTYDANYRGSNLYAVDVATGTTRLLTPTKGSWSAPAVSPTGSFLYFASDRPQRPGEPPNLDLYRARIVGDSFGEAHNLGPSVNTPGHETEPALSPEGFTLVFSSDRQLLRQTKDLVP